MGEAGVGQRAHEKAHAAHEHPHLRGQRLGDRRSGGARLLRGRLRLAEGPQAHVGGVAAQEQGDDRHGDEDTDGLDAEGRRHGQALDQQGRHRRQDDGGDAAARRADGQGQRLVLDEPAVHEDRHGDHRAEPVAQAGDGRADAEILIGRGHAVQEEGHARAGGGDGGPDPQADLAVVYADAEHREERHETPQGDQRRGLCMGEAHVVHDIGQEDREPVGDRAHGDEEQQGGHGADHPAVIVPFHVRHLLLPVRLHAVPPV